MTRDRRGGGVCAPFHTDVAEALWSWRPVPGAVPGGINTNLPEENTRPSTRCARFAAVAALRLLPVSSLGLAALSRELHPCWSRDPAGPVSDPRTLGAETLEPSGP